MVNQNLPAKPPLQSVTIWGGLISLLPVIVDSLSQISALPILPPQVSAIISAVGGVIAIIGRFNAKKPLER